MTVGAETRGYDGFPVEGLALIGVSHRRGGAAALEAWQTNFGNGSCERLRELGLAEFVPIITCNRFDLVVRLPQGVSEAEVRSRLTPPGTVRKPYCYLGEAALEQLARIAASLDSLNPGEDQIMRQVREAYARAQEQGTTGSSTAFAFQSALRIARKVRREVALAPLDTSLFSLARPELSRMTNQGDVVAVVGAGEMGTLAAKGIADLPGVRLLIVNRSQERAQQLARHLGAEHMALPEFLEQAPPLRALVTATPVKGLIGESFLRRQPGLRLLIDLGIPRNVDSASVMGSDVRVLDVDTLQVAGSRRREQLGERLAQAERVVQEELDAVLDEWAEKQLGPSIRKLREWYLETIGETLPPEEAKRLAHRFAHVPVKGLRAVAREHGIEAARTFLAETGLLE